MGVTIDRHTFDPFTPATPEVAATTPPAATVLAPPDVEEAARILDVASEHRATVLIWGGGTHQGIGNPVHPDVVLTTSGMTRVVAWEPEDLTLVVESGAQVADIEAMLAERGQTAVLPERPGAATIGGVVAAGVSGYRRARYGPTRDRMLEATMATGDGRVIRGGGRVVKNVTGYDMPRLMTGSFGRLGMIGSVCFKLWPRPTATATVNIDDPEEAWKSLYRPVAVLSTNEGSTAYLGGTPAEVDWQASLLGGAAQEGHAWPDPPSGAVSLSIRVPPDHVPAAIDHVPAGWQFIAQHGVGEVACSGESMELNALLDIRAWAERTGGAALLTAGPESLYEAVDPWGTPPPSLDLQRRIVAGFDPAGVTNPGRLPGGL